MLLSEKNWRTPFWAFLLAAFFSLFVPRAVALPKIFGDLDEDGKITILDLVRLVAFYNQAATVLPDELLFADINQDGAINQEDVELLRSAILGKTDLLQLPLTHVRSTSPLQGEASVSVTRESVFYLSLPLSTNSVVTTAQLYASFGGRKILSRVELASNRRTVTLFYLEPLPGNASIRVTFDGTGLVDFLNRPVDLDGDGAAGGVATLDFETLSLTPVENTSVSGRVFASQIKSVSGATDQVLDTPIAGVTITVDGQEQTLRTVTDPQGNFLLSPVPAGPFFVHIDGRTVTNLAAGIHYPDQAYYPYVGKQWAGVAGQDTKIGDIFLPLVAAGTLQTASITSETTVNFPTSVVASDPRLANVSLQVPAGALLSENGDRGGKIGIAPVSPDRLPGPLPPGANPALVITIQTDGPANFDSPVPACFPNLPDPQTGGTLKPGDKSALWSFNHDSGRFEIVGSMTVSADGTLVCTDPGIGILAPGWHFTNPSTQTRGGGTDCDEDGPESPNEPGTRCRPPAKPDKGPCGDATGTAGDPVQLFSGQLTQMSVDLEIKGRGFDFVWQRTYRSRAGGRTAQGNGWDHPYNVSLEASGLNLTLHDGDGRGDIYTKRADGTWTRAEFFRVISREADGSYTLTFEDKGRWGFHSFDGSPSGGKMVFSEDRNGNRMSFRYDGQGRLSVITDTLGRDITVAYTGDGFIQSIADFAGRVIRYDYYQDGDAGGGFGDLKSMTTQAVTGTPNGNDFPNGKTVTYTYSTGFADDQLNHNLLTVTDGRRNDPNDPTFGAGPYLVNIYSTATDPNDPTYDRVVRQIWGGGTLDFTYVRMSPAEPNGFALMRTIVRDRVGNVSEHFFDKMNRLVRLRQFSGRALADRPTTPLENRPANPLRSSDPDFYETVYEWTDDSLQRRMIHPNGNITEFVYESDLDPNASARTRGNLRKVRHLPGSHLPVGDQAMTEETFDYDTDFGACCGFNFVVRAVDARGNVTYKNYDARGNLIQIQHRFPGIFENFEYNDYGQITKLVHPDNGSGYRRADQFVYYTAAESKTQQGYLKQMIVDADTLKLATTYEYDQLGNVIRTIDPRGHDTIQVYNSLDQVVRTVSAEVRDGTNIRNQRDMWFDANNNVARIDVLNLDENGVAQAKDRFTTRFEYEMLNYRTLTRQDIDATRVVTLETRYDANRNPVLQLPGEATAGRQAANVTQMVYDERDLLFSETRAPGDPAQSTTQHFYDANGNLVSVIEGVEGEPRIFSYVFDSFDREVSETDPMGNVTQYQYDANGNKVREQHFGELEDVPGSAGNVLLSDTTWTLDSANRETKRETAFFATANGQAIGSGVSRMEKAYSANSQILAVTDDHGQISSVVYDTANRAKTITDAKNNTISHDYDGNDNRIKITEVHKSDLGRPDETVVSQQLFDNLNRPIRLVDNAGSTFDYAYDSRGNRVTIMDSLRGQNGQGNLTRFDYDGLGRVVKTTKTLTQDGIGGSPAVKTITTSQEWDDSDRLIAMTDNQGNATRTAYDPLNRRIANTSADQTKETSEYDVHGNLVLHIDANGTRVKAQYDLLNRLIRRDIEPGQGVAAASTYEIYRYDGMSRVVYAENDSARVARSYDSLGRVISETLNGQTTSASFDGHGNMTSATYPGGRKITMTYDELDRKKSISDEGGMIARYSYLGENRVERRELGNNTATLYSYDSSLRQVETMHSRLENGVFTAFDDRSYTWDAMSNKRERRDKLTGLSHAYSYDSLYRLVQSEAKSPNNPGASVAYNLDGAGNRVAVAGGEYPGSYVLNTGPNGPPDASVHQYTSTPFDSRRYDANGNLTGIDEVRNGATASKTLRYNYRNELVAFDQTAAGVSAVYAYDALGRRIARTVQGGNPGAVRYFYIGWHVIEEQDEQSKTVATYVYGGGTDEVLTMRRNGQNYYYHADDLGNVMKLTDGQGKVVEIYDYGDYGKPLIMDPFGNTYAESAAGNPLLFGARNYDPETGFYQLRARYLDPSAGRFISRDPVGIWTDSGNLGNGYTYCGNNPWSSRDPLGLFDGVEFAKGVGVGIGDGAWNFAKGLGELLYNLVTSPIETAKGMYSGIKGMIDQIREGGLTEAARLMFPNLYKLISQWDCLSDYEKGKLIGQMIGEYGAMYLTGVGVGKLLNQLRSVAGRALRAVTGGTKRLYNKTEHLTNIVRTGRVWGQTEGSVYGTVLNPESNSSVVRGLARATSMADKKVADVGLLQFEGQAAEVLAPHPLEGMYSGLKNVLGQYKGGFGDIVIDEADLVLGLPNGARKVIIRVAHNEGTHAGQTAFRAARRLWGRRALIDTPITYAAGNGVAHAIAKRGEE